MLSQIRMGRVGDEPPLPTPRDFFSRTRARDAGSVVPTLSFSEHRPRAGVSLTAATSAHPADRGKSTPPPPHSRTPASRRGFYLWSRRKVRVAYRKSRRAAIHVRTVAGLRVEPTAARFRLPNMPKIDDDASTPEAAIPMDFVTINRAYDQPLRAGTRQSLDVPKDRDYWLIASCGVSDSVSFRLITTIQGCMIPSKTSARSRLAG